MQLGGKEAQEIDDVKQFASKLHLITCPTLSLDLSVKHMLTGFWSFGPTLLDRIYYANESTMMRKLVPHPLRAATS